MIPSVCLKQTASSPVDPPAEILETISKAMEEQEEENKEIEETYIDDEVEEEEQGIVWLVAIQLCAVNYRASSLYTGDSDSLSCGSIDDILLENCYIATANYTRQAQDELSVQKCQMVCVVDDSDDSKDTLILLRHYH